ncbi:hypothetical protein [Ruminococcus sp.]|uniref:hypothetical protein n=1 Tax=Ruminococcus sp. TaxID=41978 RepID=UPI0025E7E8C2|nr:hypothetical protein [Ruminococcus sp.]MBQ8966594.1 hypothetical protein [Ruminococcus sp.]
MKATKLTALLMAAVMMMGGAACEHNKKGVPPADAKADFSAPDPVPVPEGGWTDETLKDVIYINDKNFDLPCTVDDLGDGFEIEPDKEADKELEDKGSASYDLDYYGYNVGYIIKMEKDTISSIYFESGTFQFSSDVREDYPYVPFSINGVTIGMPFSEAKEIIGEEYIDEEDKISLRTEHFWIVIRSCDDKTKSIQVYKKLKESNQGE